jgi:hypothetical protein
MHVALRLYPPVIREKGGVREWHRWRGIPVGAVAGRTKEER